MLKIFQKSGKTAYLITCLAPYFKTSFSSSSSGSVGWRTRRGGGGPDDGVAFMGGVAETSDEVD